MSVQVSQLFPYPIKSAAGIGSRAAVVARMGMPYDRHWMVVDRRDVMVAQRRRDRDSVAIPQLCLVQPRITGCELVVSAPDMKPLVLPLAGLPGTEVDAEIWADRCQAVDQGDEATWWFTKFLGQFVPGDYRLVRMLDDGHRQSRLGEAELAFADDFPFLIASEASLADLNRRMRDRDPAAEELGWDRFRPNVVVTGCDAYAEDRLGSFRIGPVRFTGESKCVRCEITVTDQATGELGHEPLQTLATYRRIPKVGSTFCRNCNHHGTGEIRVGMALEDIEWSAV